MQGSRSINIIHYIKRIKKSHVISSTGAKKKQYQFRTKTLSILEMEKKVLNEAKSVINYS